MKKNFIKLSVLLGIAYIIVIILKITEEISLSWDWVLSPLWVLGVVIFVILFAVGGFFTGIIFGQEEVEIEEEIEEEIPISSWVRKKRHK